MGLSSFEDRVWLVSQLTGAMIVDKQNMDQPAVKELIKPDLARWLGAE